MSIAKSQQNRKIYECINCDYKTCNYFDFTKHNNTIKHKNAISAIDDGDFSILDKEKSQNKKFMCSICNKEYKDNSGLWRHNKKCVVENVNKEEYDKKEDSVDIKNNTDNKDDLINYLIKENKEFKNLILEIVKKDTYNNSNNTTNSHNKSFNLNFFLNETCKDAMNIMDFVDSIKLQLTDLENVGEVGYVNGISNIIVKNLNELDVTKRPVHCADKKREILYVKDENKWEKDDDKKKLRKAIKRVATKNQRMLLKFKEEHPDCGYSASKYSDQYNKIIVESMGGSGDNDLEKEDKIIKNISKVTIIDKNN